LAFDGPIFVFSWPSRGTLSGYLDDRESAEVSGEALRDFLRMIVAETKVSRIHVIAHSMGNMTVRAALDKLDRATAEQLPIGEVIHAAPDIDADLFTQTFTRQQAKGAKSTIYASSVDWALGTSSFVRDRSQLGFIPSGGPTLVSGIDTIDITNASFNLFGLNHDVYAASPSIVADMRRLLKDGQRPPDKRTRELEPVVAKQGTYWRYRGPGAVLEQAVKVP
jgi:esterase/lipase superfamily enzyme